MFVCAARAERLKPMFALLLFLVTAFFALRAIYYRDRPNIFPLSVLAVTAAAVASVPAFRIRRRPKYWSVG